jgi:hypothetical protein
MTRLARELYEIAQGQRQIADPVISLEDPDEDWAMDFTNRVFDQHRITDVTEENLVAKLQQLSEQTEPLESRDGEKLPSGKELMAWAVRFYFGPNAGPWLDSINDVLLFRQMSI